MLELTGGDPLPYGLAGDEATLNRLVEHAVDQHIPPAPVALEQMFTPETVALTG